MRAANNPRRPIGRRLIPPHLNLMEIFLLGLCVFSGALNALRLASTGTVGNGTPVWAAAAWYALLLLGGTGGLVGAFWNEPLTSALITRASMYPVSAGAVAFAYITAVRGLALSAALIAVFGAFAAGHAVQVTRRARSAAAHIVVAESVARSVADQNDGG